MVPSIIKFLVMLNPFALFLYLEPVRKDLNHSDFMKVIAKATLISLGVCLLFFFLGEFIFSNIFQINFESFRIFGGIIIFSYAYIYIVKGEKAMFMMKGSLDNLASEIALPFMVGAGTISLSILASKDHEMPIGLMVIVAALALNYFIMYILKKVRDSLEGKRLKTAYDKNMEVLLRLNGFFIGAIGINMMLSGIKNVFF